MAASVVRVESLVVYCAVLVAAITDLKTKTIPNACPLSVLAARAGTILALRLSGEDPLTLAGLSLLGGVVVGLPLVLAAQITGGVGWGDVKLLTALGFIYGWQRGMVLVAVSCALSACIGVALYLARRRRAPGQRLLSTTVPMAPQIALAVFGLG